MSTSLLFIWQLDYDLKWLIGSLFAQIQVCRDLQFIWKLYYDPQWPIRSLFELEQVCRGL
jgi:hypothetical protein